MNTMTRKDAYSTSELETNFRSIQDILQEQNKTMKDSHREILDQVKYTNGKVAEVVRWKERMTGMGFLIIILLLPMLTAFFGWMAYEILNMDEKLQEALKPYEIP